MAEASVNLTVAAKPKPVSPFFREKYEKEARKNWDIYYKRNTNKGFKDRHYLHQEWGSYLLPSVQSGDTSQGHSEVGNVEPERPAEVLLEVGCGAGNTVYPLLERNPDLFIHACDFSPRAVQLVKAHKLYDESHVHAFVCDIVGDDLKESVSPASVDVAMLVFVLSAISPEKMRLAIRNIAAVLKPGGTVLLRDYASGDLAEKRFSMKESKIGESFYVRGDGTRAYYFTEDVLCELFASEGFSCRKMKVVERVIENRARALVMHRRWIQAAFCLEGCADGAAVTNGEEPLAARERSSAGADAEESARRHEGCCGLGSRVSLHEEEDEEEEEAAEGPAITELFAEPVEYVERSIPIGDMAVRVRAVHPQRQHTTPQTGLLLWDSALVLTQLLTACPEIVRAKKVLELGAGGVGICAMAAVAARASLVTATDGDPAVVEMLRDSLGRNVQACPGAERVHAERLRWGHPGDTEAVLRLSQACGTNNEENGGSGQDFGDSRHGAASGSVEQRASEAVGPPPNPHVERGYDVVFGTDVVYVAKAVPKLFSTARELLRKGDEIERENGGGGGVLILCHVTRRVQEMDILDAAQQSGLTLRSLESVSNTSVADAARQLGLNIDRQFDEGAGVDCVLDDSGGEGRMIREEHQDRVNDSREKTRTECSRSGSCNEVGGLVDKEESSSNSLFRLMCFTL